MQQIISKAAILRQINKPLEISNVLVPKKLFKGQILVKMMYSGICGSQLGEIQGVKGKDKYLPHLLGHEGIAKVIKKNSYVKKVKEGDIVLLHWMPSNGINSKNPIYIDKKNRKINAGFVTTFNEYAVVSENRLTKINKQKKNYLDYLLLGCTSSTAIGSVNKNLPIKKKSFIIVSGCGAIGLYIIKYLKFLGIKNIIGIDVHYKKIKFAKKLGCVKVFNSKEKDFIKKLNNSLSNGADYVFECSGNSNQISNMFKVLNSKGSLNLIGVPNHGSKSGFNTLDINLGKKIIGNKGGDFYAKKHISQYKKIIFSKHCNHRNFITEIIKLNSLNDYFRKMAQGKILGKGIIRF